MKMALKEGMRTEAPDGDASKNEGAPSNVRPADEGQKEKPNGPRADTRNGQESSPTNSDQISSKDAESNDVSPRPPALDDDDDASTEKAAIASIILELSQQPAKKRRLKSPHEIDATPTSSQPQPQIQTLPSIKEALNPRPKLSEQPLHPSPILAPRPLKEEVVPTPGLFWVSVWPDDADFEQVLSPPKVQIEIPYQQAAKVTVETEHAAAPESSHAGTPASTTPMQNHTSQPSQMAPRDITPAPSSGPPTPGTISGGGSMPSSLSKAQASLKAAESRRPYRCSKCGAEKKGHVCTAKMSHETQQTSSASVLVKRGDLAARLAARIQGQSDTPGAAPTSEKSKASEGQHWPEAATRSFGHILSGTKQELERIPYFQSYRACDIFDNSIASHPAMSSGFPVLLKSPPDGWGLFEKPPFP